MFKQFFSLAVCVATVSAHMQLYDPPPFRAYNNPHTIGKPDAELLFPHNCCGKVTPMPCRGYLKLLGTPEGASVANWAAGSKQSWSMVGPGKSLFNHPGTTVTNTSKQLLLVAIITVAAARLASP